MVFQRGGREELELGPTALLQSRANPGIEITLSVAERSPRNGAGRFDSTTRG
jgi:hypothetical protein